MNDFDDVRLPILPTAITPEVYHHLQSSAEDVVEVYRRHRAHPRLTTELLLPEPVTQVADDNLTLHDPGVYP